MDLLQDICRKQPSEKFYIKIDIPVVSDPP